MAPGTYESTGEMYNGAPVYSKYYGGTELSKYRDGTWRLGYVVGSVVHGPVAGVIRSVGTGACPADVSQWQYKISPSSDWKYGQYGDIMVRCT